MPLYGRTRDKRVEKLKVYTLFMTRRLGIWKEILLLKLGMMLKFVLLDMNVRPFYVTAEGS